MFSSGQQLHKNLHHTCETNLQNTADSGVHMRACEMHIWTPPFKEMALSRHMIKNECCVTVWCVCMCVWTPYTKRILRRPAGHISRNCKIQIILYKDKPSKGGWVESTKKRKKNSKYACHCTLECISVCVYIWHKFTCVCVGVCLCLRYPAPSVLYWVTGMSSHSK